MTAGGSDNDKGRFVKETLRGVPAGYGLTREEQILKMQTKQLEEMRALKEQFRSPPAAIAYPHEPRIQVAAPQVHIDIPKCSR